MKRILRTSAILAITSLLAACGGPTLDGKTQATLQTSMQKVIEALDTKEARQFQADVAFISMASMSDVKMDLKAIESKSIELLDTFDGKTADDVADLANEMREKIEAKKQQVEEARKAHGPVLNGKSELTLNKSLQEMAEGLSKDERKALESNIEVIATDVLGRSQSGMFAKEKAMQEFLGTLNDKSFKEVAELADEVRAKKG